MCYFVQNHNGFEHFSPFFKYMYNIWPTSIIMYSNALSKTLYSKRLFQSVAMQQTENCFLVTLVKSQRKSKTPKKSEMNNWDRIAVCHISYSIQNDLVLCKSKIKGFDTLSAFTPTQRNKNWDLPQRPVASIARATRDISLVHRHIPHVEWNPQQLLGLCKINF